MQPLPPGLAGLPVETAEVNTGPLAAPVPAGAAPLPPPGPTWTEQRLAEMDAAKAEAGKQQAEAAEEAHRVAARQAALESKYGSFSSSATSFFRGGLDALLLGGTAVGVLAESTGALTGITPLEKFGRDMGRASTGKSAQEALAFVLGGGGQEGAELADASNRVLREQQEARPTLTTISRLAGTAGVGLGLGAAAGGHAAAKTMLGLNMLEGGAAGAQVAYDEAAPLIDVLKSAAVGAAIGGVVTGAAEGISYAAKRAPDLTKVFGKVQESADKMAVKSAIGADSAAWNQIVGDQDRIARIAGTLRAKDLIGKGDDAIREAVEAGAAKVGAEEVALANQLNEILPVDLRAVDDLIASKAAGKTGRDRAVAAALDGEVRPLRESLTSAPDIPSLQKAVRDASQNVADLGMGRAAPGELDAARAALAKAQQELAAPVATTRAPTFAELAGFRRRLQANSRLGGGVTNEGADAFRELSAVVGKQLDDAALGAGPTVAKTWRQAAQTADDFGLLAHALERGTAKAAKAPMVSMGAVQSAVGAGIITMLTAANPIAALGMMAAGGLAHGAARKLGAAGLSALTNRFAKMGTRVSLRAAGGREMQDVLSSMAQAKAFASELSEAAGANPIARQEAEELARTIAAQQMAKRAGPMDLDAWHQKPLTPMQKVFYRGALLDKVAEDVADIAERTAALHPGLPEALDPARIAKLTRDADGPAAIGALQGKVREIAESVPPTPTGEAAAVALRRAALDVERADVAGAMTKAHELANWLDQSAAIAQDVPTQDFVRNAAKAVRAELTGEAFGEAGRLYQAMATGGNTLEGLRNVKKLREALTGLEGHGTLPATIQRAQDEIAAAYEASAKLAGTPRPKTLGKDFEAGERVLHAAEEALTLDGKAMHRVFETAQHAGIHEAAHPHAEAGEMTVADAVDGELENVVPLVRAAANGDTKKGYRPAAAAAAATLPLTIEEGRERYKEQMKKLTGAATSMSTLEEGQHPLISNGANDAIGALLRDIPKPPSGPLGSRGPEAMSSDDLRLANAMFEATVAPGSIFSDLASGYVDPDKTKYAWKQYPGYQKACQAGIVDMLANDLSQEERDAIPENILTQLDATFGFGGRLQETSDPIFAARMSEVYKTPQEKRPPPQGGMLHLPGAEPSFTQRIATG